MTSIIITTGLALLALVGSLGLALAPLGSVREDIAQIIFYTALFGGLFLCF